MSRSSPTVLVVAQAFKETFSLKDAAEALAEGVRLAGAMPDVVLGSDGGDGLLEALGPDLVRLDHPEVAGPLLAPVRAAVGWLSEAVAVVESRLICGLSLLAESERDPRRTTTRGVGEAVAQLARQGAREVIVGLGGSATMDGGVGMARAWGWVPRAGDGRELPEGGGALVDLARLDSGSPPDTHLTALTDVRNPLNGREGARAFARQKGADAVTVELLAQGLERLTDVTGQQGVELALREGAGAAGGLGFGLLYFGRATLRRGADWVLERQQFDQRLADAALAVTGEGEFDETSLSGKLPGVVIERARRAHVAAALVTPRCRVRLPDVTIESGGDRWDLPELTRRTTAAVERALRLSPP